MRCGPRGVVQKIEGSVKYAHILRRFRSRRPHRFGIVGVGSIAKRGASAFEGAGYAIDFKALRDLFGGWRLENGDIIA